MGIVLCGVIVWVTSLAYDWHSFSLCVRASVSVLLLGLVSDVAIARRRGFSIDADGLTLHYAFYRRRLRWAEVESFEWRRRITSTMMTYLCVRTRNRRFWIPSASCAENTWMGRGAARYLSSPNVRRRAGREQDALRLLNDALAEHPR